MWIAFEDFICIEEARALLSTLAVVLQALQVLVPPHVHVPRYIPTGHVISSIYLAWVPLAPALRL